MRASTLVQSKIFLVQSWRGSREHWGKWLLRRPEMAII